MKHINERAKELLQRMTLEEKIGQMNQITPSIVGGFDVSFEELIEMLTDGRITQETFQSMMANAQRDYREDDIRAGRVGSILMDDVAKANELQRVAVEESRLGIPLLIGFDVIHGMRTIFPIPLAEACSFDVDCCEKTAEIAAREARQNGISWVMAPMLDLARDARWGRVSESFGEDPYLGACYAEAKIKGFQGERGADGTLAEDRVATCIKHFVGYGGAEGGQDYNTVSMSANTLYNAYLPPFRKAVEAGALTAMAGFHDLNGVPCTVNRYLMRDVLKGEFGLEGLVTSDANAVAECVLHGVCEDRADAAIQSAAAGVDIDMGSGCYEESLRQAVETGKLSMDVIDDAALRVLKVKFSMGLFEHPYVSEEGMVCGKGSPAGEHLALARECARNSIVLLKNEGALPLAQNCRILLTGALAADQAEALGAWAISGRPSDAVTIKSGLEARGVQLTYIPCCAPEGEINEDEYSELEHNLDKVDVILAVVGETAAMSGEASSRADITLPGHQREFLRRLLETGKPVVACLMNGRPLELSWESEHLPAIVECWQLGVQMGHAVADILLGAAAPSGKLAMTFPGRSGQCPMYYNHPSTGRPGSKSKFTSRYLDAPLKPVYPFGYGMSYTSFEYSDLTVEDAGDELNICFNLKNTGDREGVEVAQLYMQDVTASIVRPVRELKGFRRVALAAGEEQKMRFALAKNQLGFYDNNGIYRVESGLFRIFVGGDSTAQLSAEIRI